MLQLVEGKLALFPKSQAFDLTCCLFQLAAMQIGSFGGITPLQSLVKNRSDLWDVAAAGPVAGVAASAALLFIGLSQSHPGGLPQVRMKWRF